MLVLFEASSVSWAFWPWLPLCLTGLSCLRLAFQYLTRQKSSESEVSYKLWSGEVRKYDITRLLCSFLLVVISFATVHQEHEFERVLVLFIFIYSLMLASCPWITSFFLQNQTTCSTHLTIILLTSLSVLLYRDAWIFATFSSRANQDYEPLEWAKIVILFIASVVTPMLKPRYSRSANASPEQTASYWSLLSYSFLDPIIWLGYSSPRIPQDALPPLASFDTASVLRDNSFQTLDRTLSKSHRHIFLNLVRLYWQTGLRLVGLLILQSFTTFLSPLAINRLLKYLEVGREESTVRPWIWILLLFFGPMISGVVLQWYIFVATRVVTQVEAILTQLVYEHVLRITLKSDAPNGSQEGSEPDAPRAQGANILGKINSLITTDLANIREARDFMSIIIYIPLHVSLAIWFLYAVLGWSAFVGLAVIIVLLPVPGYVASYIQKVEVVRMGKTDGRVQDVTETLNVLRMIKLFGWESKSNEKLRNSREEELTWIKRRQVLNMMKGISNYLIPVATMMATYATYVTLIMRQPLTPSKVFSSMSVFDILRGQFHLAFHTISQIVTAKVSLDRVNGFLNDTELLDRFEETSTSSNISDDSADDTDFGVTDAKFTWSSSGTSSSSDFAPSPFSLNIEGPVYFPKGSTTLVVGPTGSGKTSLLMALLGEMHSVATDKETTILSSPKTGSVAYAAQESWVLNDTIRNNILFGSTFDAERYREVVYQCALERDLTLFPAGDGMEIGEKGVTLSGGQKARITLARAIYSNKDILLLDDVFAALDVHTSQWIVEKCFGGGLVKGRTILLITHNVALAKKIATHVLTMGEDGNVANYDPVGELVDVHIVQGVIPNADYAKVTSFSSKGGLLDSERSEDAHISEPLVNGALVVEEEMEYGRVNWEALSLYFSNLKGRHNALFFLMFGGGIIANEFLVVIQTWYLGYWAAQYDKPEKVHVLHYLGTYGAILAVSMLIYASAYVTYIYGSLRASRKIHQKLISSILGTTLRWLDVTPTSRIIARCTQDIGAVDGIIAGMVQWLTELTVSMTVKLGAIVFVTPLFLGPGISVALFGGWLCQVYMASQLSVKREMSNAKAPVIGHFGTTVGGLVSLRAYGAQTSFIEQSQLKIDRHTRASRTFYNLNRWITIRTDLIGAVFTSTLAAYLVYFQSQSASNTGFSLNMSIAFSGMILYWVMFLNDLEIQGNSLERIQSYLKIEQEAKPTPKGIPPAYWPASGDLRVENLSSRYSVDGPEILHNLSFHVKAGEHVGIVGRTGSGKSSLMLSLLRSILTSGCVYYDNIRTDTLNLDSLRSSITIIPQVPEMLSGTLRQNLDPFDQYDDVHLNDALRSAGLFSLHGNQEHPNAKRAITLDTSISSGGSNLSIGQRQILALARAIVRGSKLLVLDEATSAIDHETDLLIQSTLRHQLGPDVTLLTVAHRLHTVMDADKIMVLDEGRIMEFDSPASLLSKPEGIFRTMVESSGDRVNLLKMMLTDVFLLPLGSARH